ncbi:hypothetical protein [Burkholderia gladioli]|uniref:hypothetical protein n=1 Tax=Burkholderia gladioli TaxID=28095 RepID=UPI001640DB1E|nr:hypothetical protein [Burkholderia gladioli]
MNTAQTYAEAEQEIINIIAVLDDDTRQRLYEAEKAYDEATDQWLQDWAADYADARFDFEDEGEKWDKARDEGVDLAQVSEDWEPDCADLMSEIAAAHGVSTDLLRQTVVLLNNYQGWALVEQRRIALGLVTTH